jgi:hypothetical protein
MVAVAVAAVGEVDVELDGPSPWDLLKVVRGVVAYVMVVELPSVGEGTFVMLEHNVEVDMLRMQQSIAVAVAAAVVALPTEDSVVVHNLVAVVVPGVAELPLVLPQ